jgi:hypothetical protein
LLRTFKIKWVSPQGALRAFEEENKVVAFIYYPVDQVEIIGE